MTNLVRPSLPSAKQLLSHIMENPSLLAAVRELPAPALGKLIESVGLEDAAEIVALARSEQLEAVFDEDLWKSEAGDWEERFDPARFALWLHVFSEAGEQAVIERLLELPLDFLTLAIQRLVLVIDVDALALEMSEGGEDAEQLEKALESCLYEEWEEFRLIARDANAWDDVLHALLALDREHHARLRQILERCAAMSSEWVDDNGGLYEVLSSDEMLESDVRAERDDRRGKKGYVSAADARAFLELARRGEGELGQRDAVTRAYFRELERVTKPLPKGTRQRGNAKANVAGLLKLVERARASESAPAEPRAPRTRTAIASAAAPTQLQRALAELRDAAPERYAERLEELGYLANVLISAPQSGPRQLRPVEALEAAMTITSLGLERAAKPAALADRSAASLAALLERTPADQLFRAAFHALCTGQTPAPPALAALPAGLLRKP